MTVHIPARNSDALFTLFARGAITHKITVADRGSLIALSGVAVLFYAYPHCRRAYIARDIRELRHYKPAQLPNVREKVGILFRARGGQIDLLRKVLFFLSDLNGDNSFRYKTVFWQRIACLVESCRGKYVPTLKADVIRLRKMYLKQFVKDYPQPNADSRA
jgi:hypothetical protein